MVSLLESIISIPVPFNMIVLIVLMCSTAGVLTTIAGEVRKYFCHREDVELKRELLASGMNASEIEQIVRVKSGAAGGKNGSSQSVVV